MRKMTLLAVCVGAALAAWADCLWGLAPDGSVWTGRATRFQFAPYLAFEEVAHSVSYDNEVIGDFHEVTNVTSRTASVAAKYAHE